MAYRFGLELYSISDEFYRDMPGALKAVKEMGYEAVEFFGRYVYTAGEISDSLAAAGLVCCGWHTPFDYLKDDMLRSTIEYNNAIGNSAIIIPGIKEEMVSAADWMNVAARVDYLAGVLAAEGLRLGYHLHDTDFTPVDGETPCDLLFANTRNTVIAQVDCGNVLQAGADACAAVKRYPGREWSVHVKPYSHRDGFDTMIGEDDVPWSDFIETCREVGGTQWYIVEYEGERKYQPMDGVKRCLDALRILTGEATV